MRTIGLFIRMKQLLTRESYVWLSSVAGAFFSSMAPSVHGAEVVLYGGVDGGISYVHTSQNGNTSNRLGLDSSVLAYSMIGFRGSDNLTNDWSVSFDLASEINIYDGSISYDSFFGIESTLGLRHRDWGSLKVGRQMTISTDFFNNFDPLQLSFGQANMGTSFTAVNTQIYNNLIQYTSSNWSGFQFGVGYSFDTGESALYAASGTDVPVSSSTGFGTNNKMRALTAAAQYSSGPLLLVASYDKAYPSDTIPGGGNSQGTITNPERARPQAWYFGVGFTVNNVVLSAAWGRGINGAFSGSGPGNDLSGSPLASITGDAGMLFSQGYDQNAYLLGFSWAIDSNTQFMASWQMLKPTGQLALTTGIASQQILGAALTYNLSKRTAVYLWGSYGNNFQLSSGAKASVIGSGIQTLF